MLSVQQYLPTFDVLLNELVTISHTEKLRFLNNHKLDIIWKPVFDHLGKRQSPNTAFVFSSIPVILKRVFLRIIFFFLLLSSIGVNF